MTSLCSCSGIGTDTHQPGCPVAYTAGLVVPAPGVDPLATSTVTVLRSCAAHPGTVLDACPACLAAAEVERDAARRDGAVWEAEAGRYQNQRDAARREAAEAQAREARLHVLVAAANSGFRQFHNPVAVHLTSCQGCGWFDAADAVLALPADHTALDALLAQARREAAEAQAREGALRAALAQVEDRAPDEPDDGEERGDLWRDVIESGRIARQALALPADRTALDALLARARREPRVGGIFPRDQFSDGCPFCGHRYFQQGPEGGLSINFRCAGCYARFNDIGPFGIEVGGKEPKP